MFKSKSSLFDEDIEKATHENNLTEDWALIMHICDKAVNYDDGAKFCLKAIIKRLYHNVPLVVLQALTLLDACVKNCDRRFLLQIASSEFTNEVRKLLSKMHPEPANKLKELIQRWSLEEFKDDPELCIIPALYYKLKSEGVAFPTHETKKKSPVLCTNPDGVSSQEEEEDIIKAIEISLKDTGRYVLPDEYKNVETVSSSESFTEPMKVRAIYDFEAAEDNELTIKVGEIVVVSDNSNASWWKGSNHRGEGLFPSNFVTEDLEFKPEEPVVPETAVKTEIDSEVLEDIEVKLDEKKIELVIDWLNDTDPTSDLPDPEDMLLLEKQCYSMAPIIEENLQAIDNKLAKLNLVNEKIMTAFNLFHDLSGSIPVFNPSSKLLSETSNQHTVQFPNPKVRSFSSSAIPTIPVLQSNVPDQLPVQASVAASHSNSETVSLPVTTTVQSSTSQEPPNPPSSAVNTVPQQRVTEVIRPVETTAAHSTTNYPVPFTQVNPGSNLSTVGGFYVQPQHYPPYIVPSGPNLQQPGYIQSPASMSHVMPLPFADPQMRPYFPVQYYYVSGNLPQPAMLPLSSAEAVIPSDQKPAISTTTQAAMTANSSTPVMSNYSYDLHSLNLAQSSGDTQSATQDVLPSVHKEQISGDTSKTN